MLLSNRSAAAPPCSCAAAGGAARAGIPLAEPRRDTPEPRASARGHHAGGGEHRRAVRLAGAGQSAVPGSLLPALLRAVRPAGAAPVRRLRRDRGRGHGLRADQPSRDPGRARGRGDPEGSAPAPGQDRRQRRRHRHRAAADRGRQAEGAAGRRFRRAAGGRLRPGDRQPLRTRSDRHVRHRQRLGPHRGQHRRLRGLHSDRRGDQPGQLRRRAGQSARRADRHQQRDLRPQRRQRGDRLCRAEQHGARGHGAADQARRDAARALRRDIPGSDARPGPGAGAGDERRRGDRRAGRRRAGRARRVAPRATSSRTSTATRSGARPICAIKSACSRRARRSSCGWFAMGRRAPSGPGSRACPAAVRAARR